MLYVKFGSLGMKWSGIKKAGHEMEKLQRLRYCKTWSDKRSSGLASLDLRWLLWVWNKPGMKKTGHEDTLAWNGLALKKQGMKWKICKDFVIVKLDLINVAQVSLRSTFANCFGFGIGQAWNILGMKRHWQEMVWHLKSWSWNGKIAKTSLL